MAKVAVYSQEQEHTERFYALRLPKSKFPLECLD